MLRQRKAIAVAVLLFGASLVMAGCIKKADYELCRAERNTTAECVSRQL